MRVETHQRRIRKAVAALNRVIKAAYDDDVYADFDVDSTANNDSIWLSVRIRGWEIDEPKPPKKKAVEEPVAEEPA